MRITYHAAISLDGYIAKKDGNVSWLDELGVPMEETGYEAFFATVDALVMGRATYDFVQEYGSWPYGQKPTWVCTHQSLQAMEGCSLQPGREPGDVIRGAETLGIDHLWLLGGGKLARSFLEQKLLTHLDIVQMPIVLGSGIPLFDKLEEAVPLETIQLQTHDSGFTRLRYEVRYGS